MIRALFCIFMVLLHQHSVCGFAPASAQILRGKNTLVRSIAPASIFEEDSRPVVLFDGVCVFCNTWVDLALKIDKEKKLRFTPLQSEAGKALLEWTDRDRDDISTIVLVDSKRRAWIKSDAVLQITEIIGGGLELVGMWGGNFIPKFLRNSAYDAVASNRYSLMGKRTECRCSDAEFGDRFL
jgi:predicted DCC family thiol-disulfide oxidoreductase YuxK